MKDFQSDDEFINSLTAAQARYLRKIIAEIKVSNAQIDSQLQELKKLVSESSG